MDHKLNKSILRDNNYKRMSAVENFLLMSFLVSLRSPDAQTQCGCILVKDGSIVSTGYNGFLRNAPDDILPNTRPEKYKYIVHSEANAIYNAARHGINLSGSVAYVTGVPCPECLKSMIQCGISEIYYTDLNPHFRAGEESSFLQELIKMHNVKVHVISLDKSKIQAIKELQNNNVK